MIAFPDFQGLAPWRAIEFHEANTTFEKRKRLKEEKGETWVVLRKKAVVSRESTQIKRLRKKKNTQETRYGEDFKGYFKYGVFSIACTKFNLAPRVK